MSEETTTPEETTPEESTTVEAPAPLEVESIFIIAQRKDGTYFATVNLQANIVATRQARVVDIKTGCSEILDTIRNNELSGLILGKLSENSASESDKVASSIRQALSDKGIL
jgi:hypothetical protein